MVLMRSAVFDLSTTAKNYLLFLQPLFLKGSARYHKLSKYFIPARYGSDALCGF
jgi:hypothetical protein